MNFFLEVRSQSKIEASRALRTPSPHCMWLSGGKCAPLRTLPQGGGAYLTALYQTDQSSRSQRFEIEQRAAEAVTH
jgi:hypothetical protein